MKYHRHPLLKRSVDPELEVSLPSRASLTLIFSIIFVKLTLSNMKLLFMLLARF